MPQPPEAFDTGVAPDAVDAWRPRPLETPWGTMALYRLGDQVLCSQAFCPHLEGPLFQGTLSGTTVTCPWHQWRYDLHSGKRVDLACPPSGPDARALVCLRVSTSDHGTLLLHPPAADRHASP